MPDFVRRLVSGEKARYKDEELDVDLGACCFVLQPKIVANIYPTMVDLAYITDRVIVMGYPAIGFEGKYRNRREDAKRFLQHRHGEGFWVFNFCPTSENSYSSSVFDDRVSRYPFPDHQCVSCCIINCI